MAVTAVDGLVVGIDTHLDVHVAAVLNRLGQRLAVRSFPATDAGNAQLTRWLDSLGMVAEARMEGTGNYGYRRRTTRSARLPVMALACSPATLSRLPGLLA